MDKRLKNLGLTVCVGVSLLLLNNQIAFSGDKDAIVDTAVTLETPADIDASRFYKDVTISSELHNEDKVILCLSHPSVTGIKRLDLSQVYCLKPDKLVAALKKLTSLEDLDLSHRGMTPEEINEFAAFLSTHGTLLRLNLRCNELKNEGLCTIARAIEGNTALLELDVSSNTNFNYDDPSDEAAKAFAKALVQNRTLKTLHLGTNNISDEGAFSFLDPQIAGVSGRAVNLSGNSAILKEAVLLIRDFNPSVEIGFE